MSQAAIISQKIDSIIAQRKLKAVDIRKKRDALIELKNILNSGRAISVKAGTLGDDEMKKSALQYFPKQMHLLTFVKSLTKPSSFTKQL